MEAKQLLQQVVAGVDSLKEVVLQELKEAEGRFEQFVKLKELAMLDERNRERLRESMGDNVKRRGKMEKALKEIEKVVQEVVMVGSLVELCMEKVVEEEMKVAELPFTLQEKVSRWPDLSKVEIAGCSLFLRLSRDLKRWT